MRPLTNRELKDRYEEFLDEIYGEVEICGLKYSASKAFKEVDPIAFRCGFADWLDSECQNETLFEKDDDYYLENPNET